nr:MAG TPA: NikA, BACTERIAL CONJUGATION, RELAXASE, DNA [Caudoviricetes sp.]
MRERKIYCERRKRKRMDDGSYKNAEIKIRITEREKNRLYTVCEHHGVNPSQVLRDLIHTFCIKNKDKLNKM